MEEPEPDHPSDHILDWFEDSAPLFSSFMTETYNSDSISYYQWWDESPDAGQDLINGYANSLSSSTTISTTVNTTPQSRTSNHLPPSDLTKKRKAPYSGKNKDNKNEFDANQGGRSVKKSAGNRKNSSKNTESSYNNESNREGRWAEQLLNPCAVAIVKGDITRVHHLLCVLEELASPTGDANHRLAAYGLHALSSSTSVTPVTFNSTDPRFFQRSLIKFHEVSPWFAIFNNIANSSILQILSEEPNQSRNLHILDIGVSHGVQWPILLEALTHCPNGPPPLIRLTVIENDQNTDTDSRLLSFAKSLNINLQINRLENRSLHCFDAETIGKSSDETLIVCAQFRLHELKHCDPDERTEFLIKLREMEPNGVILSENNMACSCSNCGNFDTGFTRRIEYLWRFLDSTSSAFKGRESEERRVMEGEAAKVLRSEGEMNEEREKWCERVRGVGFERRRFGEDAIEGARGLMRRYDSKWEMRVEEKDGCVELWWKGQPVSFSSFWKLRKKPADR